ncbi:MAG: AraC family transcriptional regulator [Actinomycetota bacterium]
MIQFTADWLDRSIEVIPELREVRPLIDSSSRGIVFSGLTAIDAAALIERVGDTGESSRVVHMLALLTLLTRSPESDRFYVAHELYSSDVGRAGKAAVDAGFAYILENLTGEIRMSEAARLAYMSEPSFSKYFKKASGMTFSDMVKRLRIASACRLLEQSDASVSTISVEVGYRNLANFNRQFRAEMKMTPRAYRALDPAEKPHAQPVGLGLYREDSTASAPLANTLQGAH